MATTTTGSPAFHLNSTDLRKIGKGLLIAATGSSVAYLVEHQVEFLQALGAPVLYPLASMGLHALLKWIQDTQ